MKQFFALLIMFALLVTGCDSNDGEKKIGVIRHTNVTEDALEKAYERIDPNHQKSRYVFFNSMTEMTAALQAEQIDEFATYEVVGNYLNVHNPNFEWTTNEPALADAFCCAMREEDTALKKQFNDAVDAIITDGTLKELVKFYIVDANHIDPPAAVEMPTFYFDEYDEQYEPPLKIGVTGDLPPLDYVRPDGLPAGFNTAVLSEISRRLKRNFLLVPIDGGARAFALTSKQVDVVFWVIVPTYDGLPIDSDKPDGVILTDPFFTDEIVHVKLKK